MRYDNTTIHDSDFITCSFSVIDGSTVYKRPSHSFQKTFHIKSCTSFRLLG